MVLSVAALLLAGTAASARVYVIGIDGGSWNVVDELMAAGRLPNLSEIKAGGVTAYLETVEPVISPVVWAAIATGRSPEANGVVDFYGTRLRMKVPTVFERLAAGGLHVGIYDYLMTWPPVTLPGGFVIPGWLRRDASITPPDVWDRIGLSPFVANYDHLKTNEDYLQLAMMEPAAKATRFLKLVEAFDIDVATTVFYGADMTSHRFWREAYPQDFAESVPASDPKHATAIRDAMKGIDRAIGKIAVSMRPEDSMLIVSDHGFHAAEEPRAVWVTNFREAAERVGLKDGEGFSVRSVFGAVIVRVHPGPFAEQEAILDRLVELLASYRSKDGTPLTPANLVDVAERPPGAERPFAARLRQWATGLAVKYWFGVELDTASHAYLFSFPAADELEALWPDATIEVSGKEMPVSAAFNRQGFTGEHDPIGILIASGGPIRKRAPRGPISVLDIAPLVHYLAGSPVPDDLEGQVPQGWINFQYLQANPVKKAPAAAFAPLPQGAALAEDPASQELTEKLRALGYVE